MSRGPLRLGLVVARSECASVAVLQRCETRFDRLDIEASGRFAGPARPASRPLLRPPPDLGIRISYAGLRVFIPLQLDLELERLPDVFGRALVGVLDGLGVLVPVDRAGAALMQGGLARLVVVGEGPVLAGDELEPATLRGRLLLFVGGTGEVPRADEPLGERRRTRIRLGLSALGPQAGNQGDRKHEGERGG